MVQVDLNRAGVPLLEIVSEPDLRSGIEAAEYAAEIQRLVRYLGVSNGNMQEGSLRCDVNVSVRPIGQSELGTKVISSLQFYYGIRRLTFARGMQLNAHLFVRNEVKHLRRCIFLIDALICLCRSNSLFIVDFYVIFLQVYIAF